MYLPGAGHQANQWHLGVCNSANTGGTVDKNLHSKRFCCNSLFKFQAQDSVPYVRCCFQKIVTNPVTYAYF